MVPAFLRGERTLRLNEGKITPDHTAGSVGPGPGQANPTHRLTLNLLSICDIYVTLLFPTL